MPRLYNGVQYVTIEEKANLCVLAAELAGHRSQAAEDEAVAMMHRHSVREVLGIILARLPSAADSRDDVVVAVYDPLPTPEALPEPEPSKPWWDFVDEDVV